MNRHILRTILLAFLVVFISCGAVFAAGDIYVNTSQGLMSGSLSETYAVGAGGTSVLGTNNVYVLSGSGLSSLSYSEPEPTGGGGLVSDSGSIKVKSNTVFVGLKYYYSSYRDTGVATASLENAAGRGYSFGYYDNDRVFNEVASTLETKITMRPTGGTGIGVYVTGTDSLIYEVDATAPGSMLAVKPLCEGDKAVTWFSGYKYYGDFAYAVLGAGKISVINIVDVEQYVMGVLGSEMNNSWPLEALKAQAVCARTYAQRNLKASTYYYNCGFDLTNDTYCQAYSGCQNIGANIINAVQSTNGQYLTYGGALCDALYFSSDGGATEDNYNVNGNSYHSYLKGVIDPYEDAVASENRYSSWTVVMTSQELGKKVGLSDVEDVDVTYSDMGNVIGLKFTSSDGKTATLQRANCRTSLGLYSIRYEITQSGGSFVFEGSGWGHNVGMSQFGAYSMAKNYYKTYKEILGFYFTGVSLSNGVL